MEQKTRLIAIDFNWAYLKKGLVDFCVGWYLHFVEFLIEFGRMIVYVLNSDDKTCGRR